MLCWKCRFIQYYVLILCIQVKITGCATQYMLRVMSILFLSCIKKNECPYVQFWKHPNKPTTWPRNIMDHGAWSCFIIQSHAFHRSSRHLSWNRWRWRGGIRDTIINVKGDTTPGKHVVFRKAKGRSFTIWGGIARKKTKATLRSGEETPRIQEEFIGRHVGQSLFRNMATTCQYATISRHKAIPTRN